MSLVFLSDARRSCSRIIEISKSTGAYVLVDGCVPALSVETKASDFGVLELSANHYDRNRMGGITDPNSGGFQLYLTPGIQYATRRWIADLGVKVPIVNDINGTGLEPDYSILTSIRINY